ncbi:MAG: HAMP domain-containing histidine kinase [Sandaracinus sp.]|nr:HAMP domain-containing histidine kinase [Sandaracinus sp.]MCB9619867.1 HAMP domain-containing histidine kinase [Sandaracinus sp.]MCB9634765.1 HAMP domain-containing histidine kinase [Sandaracinus sp.]
MSRLSRRVAYVSLGVLGLELVAALALQVAVSRGLRGEIIHQLTRAMEDSGSLRDCTDRPGPWVQRDGWWSVWPLTAEGEPVGEGAPLRRVALPAAGALEAWSEDGEHGVVYGATSRGCGGLLVSEHARFPMLDGQSSRIAPLAGLRVLLVLLAALALVALTALPLVRRIRALSRAMGKVVEDDFEGVVADGRGDELGDVARAFDQATKSARQRLAQLEHRDAILRRALADLAHDLRTPLATLKLSASGLPASTAATTIRSELAFLEGMTESFEALLDGADEDEVENVALDGLLERLRHRFAPLARDRGLAFDVALPDEALHARASSVALERAVGNLLQNALRFAEAHVVLLLFRDQDEVRLEVRDDGPGFGSVHGRAAERGVRGEHSSGEGFGLGLAIAEAAARRYGGRLELNEGEEGETLVALVLPVAHASSE